MRAHRARWTLLAAVLLAGCGGSVDSLSVPNPPPDTVTTAPTALTFPRGLENVTQSTVAGETTLTTPAMGPGGATLNGTVLGPAGPVAGATVEVVRFVQDEYRTVDLTSKPDGSWSLPKILGGRYRVRAWLPPTLDMVSPQIIYLSDSQRTSLTLTLTQYSGTNISVAINPPTPYVNQPLNLIVEVTNPTVGGDGVITNPPVTGASVSLVNGPDWNVMFGNPLTTNTNGQALFQVSCTVPGDDPLSAQVGSSNPVSLQLPPCSEPPPPTTTTTAPAPTTTCPPGSTTTTVVPFGQPNPGPPAQSGC